MGYIVKVKHPTLDDVSVTFDLEGLCLVQHTCTKELELVEGSRLCPVPMRTD